MIIGLIISIVLFLVVAIAMAVHSRHMNRRFKVVEGKTKEVIEELSDTKKMAKDVAESHYLKVKAEMVKKLDEEAHGHRKYADLLVLKERKLHIDKMRTHEREEKRGVQILKKELTKELRKLQKGRQSLKRYVDRHKKSSNKKIEELKKRIAKLKVASKASKTKTEKK